MTLDGPVASICVEGLLIATETRGQHLERMFKLTLPRLVGAAGWSLFSMGGDHGWIDGDYVPVVTEKLRWCDRVAWGPNSSEPLFISPEPAEPLEHSDPDGICLLYHVPPLPRIVGPGRTSYDKFISMWAKHFPGDVDQC